MSNHSKILMKMNTYFFNLFALFESASHPAAGKSVLEKTKKRSTATAAIPKATPDSLNMRGVLKKQDTFRRNPAP